MRSFLVVLFSVSFIGASCGVAQPVVPEDVSDCTSACKRMHDLGCKEGDDVKGPRGIVPCAAFCEETVKKGVPLNPSCISGISECSQIETRCAVGRER